MKYRRLGRSGLKVSPLCLGTMTFGAATDEPESVRIAADAFAAGINFLDTADAYSNGVSEEIVGRIVRENRQQWIIATKLANPTGKGPNGGGLSRHWMMNAVEASLRRLGTDYLDIYYFHREDYEVPLTESVRAMGDLIQAGKVRYFGLSNFRGWRIAEICNLCDRYGIDRPVVLQPYYNAVNRMPEVEQLPAAGYFGLGVVPYSPVARGVLTGKYRPDVPPPADTRAGRKEARFLQTEWRPESLGIAAKVADHARKVGISPAAFATAWVLSNALVSSVIAGPRTIGQWQEYRTALDYRFTSDDEALIDGLVAAGHPSTPGYNDPAYPIEGRPLRD
jgi:aryl-alcohol dehydrogenase (NADP+)